MASDVFITMEIIRSSSSLKKNTDYCSLFEYWTARSLSNKTVVNHDIKCSIGFSIINMASFSRMIIDCFYSMNEGERRNCNVGISQDTARSCNIYRSILYSSWNKSPSILIFSEYIFRFDDFSEICISFTLWTEEPVRHVSEGERVTRTYR